MVMSEQADIRRSPRRPRRPLRPSRSGCKLCFEDAARHGANQDPTDPQPARPLCCRTSSVAYPVAGAEAWRDSLLLVVSQYHLGSCLSSGSVFAPEFAGGEPFQLSVRRARAGGTNAPSLDAAALVSWLVPARGWVVPPGLALRCGLRGHGAGSVGRLPGRSRGDVEGLHGGDKGLPPASPATRSYISLTCTSAASFPRHGCSRRRARQRRRDRPDRGDSRLHRRLARIPMDRRRAAVRFASIDPRVSYYGLQR